MNRANRTERIEKEIDNLSKFFFDALKREKKIGEKERKHIEEDKKLICKQLCDLEKEFKEKIGAVERRINSKLNRINSFGKKIEDLKQSTPRIAVDTYNRVIEEPEVLSKITGNNLPDIHEVSSLQFKIGDKSIVALIKRLFEIGGYKRRPIMVKDLAVMIEDGIQFVAEERGKILEEKRRDSELIEKEFEQRKRTFEDRLVLLKKKERKVEENITREKDEFWEKISKTQQLKVLRDHLIVATKGAGLGGNDWGEYKKPIKNAEEVCLGQIAIPVFVPKQVLRPVCKKLDPFMKIGGQFTEPCIITPYMARDDLPVNMLIKYNESTKNNAIKGVQSILAKMTHEKMPGSFDITYIDPIDRGTNLGVLQELINIPGTPIFRSICASKEEIQRGLSFVQSDVDALCRVLRDTKNIYDHNKTQKKKEKTHVVVINDYPKNFTQAAADALEVLINNSEKCGVSLIILMNSEIESIDKGMNELLEVAMKKNEFIITEVDEKCFKLKKRGSNTYLFNFDNTKGISRKYLDTLIAGFDDRVKIDNAFSNRVLCEGHSYKEYESEISIPFAVDNNNQLKKLIISSPEIAHSIITGKNGSGKSTALHTIIGGLMWSYSPNEVELWLVDYAKVEFAQYANEKVAHIKLVGLENTAEFSYGLIDKLVEEQKRRTEIFFDAGVENIFEYNLQCKKKDRVPRLVVIIDEFHNMSNHISIDTKTHPETGLSYKIVLESLLREVRKLGVSFIFSDQSATSGLRGLTPDARDQIHNRIAMMSNNTEDLYEAVGYKTGKYTEGQKDFIKREGSLLMQGDTLLCELIKDEYDSTPKVKVDRYKVLYCTRESRNQIINSVKRASGEDKNTEVFSDSGRKAFSVKEINKYEGKYPLESTTYVPLYLGTPTSLKKCYRIPLETNSGNNLMILGTDMNQKMSVIFYLIRCFLRKSDCKVVILASEDDSLYRQYREKFEKIKEGSIGRVSISTKMVDICHTIGTFNSRLLSGELINELIIYLGAEAILDDLSLLPVLSELKSDRNIESLERMKADSLDELLTSLTSSLNNKVKEFRGDDEETTDNNKGESFPLHEFDARDMIKTIVTKGPRKACFTTMVLERSSVFRKMRPYVELDNFDHRIATRITVDDALNFMGKSSVINGLNNDIAAYSFGGANYEYFRPYLLPEER